MKFSQFITVSALVLGVISVQADSTTLNTIPEGVVTYQLPATGGGSVTTYLSLALTNDPIYTGAVASISASGAPGADTINVDDNPPPWTANALANAGFVKFLTGAEIGRVMKVIANATNSLTLDITDNSSQVTNLAASSFTVAAGDTFEVFPAYTLASVFGDNSANNPLLLKGSSGSIFVADTVSIYNAALLKFQAYFFNTTAGYWELSGSTANANNTILYPYAALAILRRSNEAALAFSVMGRVAEVPVITKTTGSGSVIYASTGYATDLTLSQLKLGPNWKTGSSTLSADTISIWNPALLRFDAYYQLGDSTWRQAGNATTDQSSFVIPAGSGISILQRGAVSGASSFLPSTLTLPYALN